MYTTLYLGFCVSFLYMLIICPSNNVYIFAYWIEKKNLHFGRMGDTESKSLFSSYD